MQVINSSHPQAELLCQFHLGQLDAEQSNLVESHVAVCDECAAFLDAIPDDTLVHLLRAQDTELAEQPSIPVAASPAPDNRAGQDTQSLISDSQPEVPPSTGVSEVPATLRDHPRYRIIRFLGRGGMGDVYLAEHLRMARLVALKVIKPELLSQELLIKRFHTEVKAVARLAHANIVHAHDADQAGDWHFLVMEYVEGESLGDYLKARGRLPVAEASDYVRQAALGLQHAHERGLTHRDIKPHNLRRTPDGQIKVLDFGLALLADKSVEESQNDTRPGMAIGTADYISPEQSEDSHRVDIRSDIYSLGCTLYHLLAGQTPFPKGSAIQKLVSHVAEKPTSLSQIRPEVPAELVAVVEKMMAKKPADRYQTPAQVAEALVPFTKEALLVPTSEVPRTSGREGDRLSLETAPASELLAKDAPVVQGQKRRRWSVVMIAVAACLLLTLGIAAGVVIFRIQTDEGEVVITPQSPDVEIVLLKGGKEVQVIDTKTQKRLTIPTGIYDVTVRNKPDGIEVKTDRIVVSRGKEALVIIERMATPPKQPARRRIEDVIDLSRAKILVNDEFADPRASGFGWGGWKEHFKNGRIVLTGESAPAWGTNTHQFTDFACEVVARVHKPPHRGWGLGLLNSVDAGTKPPHHHGIEVLLDDKGNLSVVPTRWAKDKAEEQPTVGPIRMSVHEPGEEFNSLAVLLRGGRKLEIFVNGREACEPIMLKHPLQPAVLQLVSAGGATPSVLEFKSYKVWSLGLTKAPPLLKPALELVGEVRRFEGHVGSMRAVVWSRDTRRVYSAGDDKVIRIWNTATGAEVGQLQGHESRVLCLALSPDGRILLSGGSDATARVWDTATGKELHRLEGVTGECWGIALSPDGKHALAEGGEQGPGHFGLWEVASGKRLLHFTGQANCLAFHPDGRHFLLGGSGGRVKMLAIDTGRPVRSFKGHTAWIRAVAISADGRRALSVSGAADWGAPNPQSAENDSTVRCWGLEEGVKSCVFRGHTHSVYAGTFIPGQPRILTASLDKTIRLWDLVTQKELLRWELEAPVTCLAVSPDGRYAFSGGTDGIGRMWRLPDLAAAKDRP
jgi:tRNA A-37 threonylcarbamoyl transferase component Bud32